MNELEKFQKRVHEYFDFLLSDYDFIIDEDYCFYVNYKNNFVTIKIAIDPNSYEVVFEISRIDDPYNSYGFEDIFAAKKVNPPNALKGYTAINEDLQCRILERISSLFKEYSIEMVNENFLWKVLKKSREKEVLDYALQKIYHQSDSLWSQKNYKDFIALLTPYQSSLNELNKKRLEYAKNIIRNNSSVL